MKLTTFKNYLQTNISYSYNLILDSPNLFRIVINPLPKDPKVKKMPHGNLFLTKYIVLEVLAKDGKIKSIEQGFNYTLREKVTKDETQYLTGVQTTTIRGKKIPPKMSKGFLDELTDLGLAILKVIPRVKNQIVHCHRTK